MQQSEQVSNNSKWHTIRKFATRRRHLSAWQTSLFDQGGQVALITFYRLTAQVPGSLRPGPEGMTLIRNGCAQSVLQCCCRWFHAKLRVLRSGYRIEILQHTLFLDLLTTRDGRAGFILLASTKTNSWLLRRFHNSQHPWHIIATEAGGIVSCSGLALGGGVWLNSAKTLCYVNTNNN